MADPTLDLKISQLPDATGVEGTDLIPVVVKAEDGITLVTSKTEIKNIQVEATSTELGSIQLGGGDLAGTAREVRVPGLLLKSPIDSPNFTGTVRVPTPPTGDDSTKAVNSIWVNQTITDAIAAIPDPAHPPESISGHIEEGEAKEYILDYSAAYDYSLESIAIATSSGTCTAAIHINGTLAVGYGNIAVTFAKTTVAPSTKPLVAAGSKVSLILSNTQNPLDVAFTFKIQRP